MKVALIQTALKWENIAANLEMFDQKINEITEEVSLIVLPEMFSTGFSMNAATLAETMDGSAFRWMKQKAAEKNAVICGSLIITENKKFYNRLIWMQPDGEFETYDKRHLFALSDEPQIYTAGCEQQLTSIGEWRVAPLICYDLRFPVWSRNVGGYYDVLVYVANWPERRNTAWKTLLQARAIENQCYVIGVNRVGEDGNGIYHSGDSMVIDPLGTILYHAEHTEQTHIATLNLTELRSVRERFPFLKSADNFEIQEC